MSILASIVGGGLKAPIDAIGNVIDKLFTSDEERLSKKILKQRLLQQPSMAQIELNKVEAQHRSLFVAGWRPFIGWVCGIGLLYDFVFRPIAAGFGFVCAPLDISTLHSLVYAMLGLGAVRTVEKLCGRTK